MVVLPESCAISCHQVLLDFASVWLYKKVPEQGSCKVLLLCLLKYRSTPKFVSPEKRKNLYVSRMKKRHLIEKRTCILQGVQRPRKSGKVMKLSGKFLFYLGESQKMAKKMSFKFPQVGCPTKPLLNQKNLLVPRGSNQTSNYKKWNN